MLELNQEKASNTLIVGTSLEMSPSDIPHGQHSSGLSTIFWDNTEFSSNECIKDNCHASSTAWVFLLFLLACFSSQFTHWWCFLIWIYLPILNQPISAAEVLSTTPPATWYQTYTHLSLHITFFLWQGLASSTRLTYRTGQRLFTDFITLYPQFRNIDGSILPASQTALLEWVAWLGGVKQLQPKMIKAYIMHLQSAHIDADMPFSACKSPLPQRVIRGIKWYMGEKDRSASCPLHVKYSGAYSRPLPTHLCLASSTLIILYHPSSGWVSITFGQDPSHSDDYVTQYKCCSPLQYMASSLSCITIGLSLSNLPPSIQFASVWAYHPQTTSSAHFHKAWLNIHMSHGLGQICGPYHCRENMWNEEGSETNEVLKGDKVPLMENCI